MHVWRASTTNRVSNYCVTHPDVGSDRFPSVLTLPRGLITSNEGDPARSDSTVTASSRAAGPISIKQRALSL